MDRRRGRQRDSSRRVLESEQLNRLGRHFHHDATRYALADVYNQYGLGGSLAFLVDDDPVRHNLVTPAYHIPVLGPQALYDEKLALVVVLAPLYAELIVSRHRQFLEEGGQFLLFQPEFKLIASENAAEATC